MFFTPCFSFFIKKLSRNRTTLYYYICLFKNTPQFFQNRFNIRRFTGMAVYTCFMVLFSFLAELLYLENKVNKSVTQMAV